MPGALEGIRLLEVTRVVPGAFCTMILAGMGAEVIKVEMPPDRHTRVGSGSGSGLSPQPGEEGIAVFSHTNRNKKSVAIDLKRSVPLIPSFASVTGQTLRRLHRLCRVNFGFARQDESRGQVIRRCRVLLGPAR